ncbi:MAG: hypothetical protein KF778_11375 [Rhodocyclaceae bacterium]|nr:hypothetical protein [Rhodocyclaceae bacterium]MBX3668995.1 hypothetical protein [Rhodocyclaceae bacterium]
MNITLPVDEKTAERARKVAQAMGKSLNQVVCEYLEHLAGTADAGETGEELRRLSLQSGGDSRGLRFDREALHERS